jgi:hypothetical protein
VDLAGLGNEAHYSLRRLSSASIRKSCQCNPTHHHVTAYSSSWAPTVGSVVLGRRRWRRRPGRRRWRRRPGRAPTVETSSWAPRRWNHVAHTCFHLVFVSTLSIRRNTAG